MAEERRKRRSKEEVAAAREQYLKEREARQQARAERKAQWEQLIAERQARKEQREKLKTMSEPERAQARYRIKLEKIRNANKEQVHPIQQIKPYQDKLTIGNWYTIRFAGSLVYGQYIQEQAAGVDEENGTKRRYSLFLFRSKMAKPGGGFWTYPVTSDNILCEGILTEEKCEGIMHPVFNGISYY